MRALDLLEKLAHAHPEWIEPHKRVFIGPLADSDQWEIQLQIVRAVPLFTWTRYEQRRVRAILLRAARHPRPFVKAWAVDSLARLAQTDATLISTVRARLREFERSGRTSLMSRAKHVRKRLSSM